MDDWTINGLSPDAYCLRMARLSERNQGTCELEMETAKGWDGAAPFTYGQAVVVRRGATAYFSGTVAAIAALGKRPGGGWSITAGNGWQDLAERIYEQATKSLAGGVTLENAVTTQVVLGQSGSTGVAEPTGTAMAAVIAYAAGKGDDVAVGDIFTGIQAPPTDATDISCGDAIRKLMRWSPDAVAWIDGAENFSVQAAADLPVVAWTPGDGDSVTAEEVTALSPVGVKVLWVRTHSTDGQQQIEVLEEVAGSMTGKPAARVVTIPLAGTKSVRQYETIRTITIPADDEMDSVRAKKFYQSMVPWLNDVSLTDLAIEGQTRTMLDPYEDSIDAEGTITPNGTTPAESADPDDYPRRLLAGNPHHDWLSFETRPMRIKARVFYKGTDRAVIARMGSREWSPSATAWYSALDISAEIVATTATPGTHGNLESIEFGEDPIEGLAAAYWDAIKGEKWRGSIVAAETDTAVQLRVGKTVTIAGKFTAPAILQAVTFDLIGRRVEAQFGFADHLDIQDLYELGQVSRVNAASWHFADEKTAGKTGVQHGAKITTSTPLLGGAGPGGGKADEGKAWDLSVYGTPAAPKVRVKPGTIRRGDSVTDDVTITGIDGEFSPVAGDFLYLSMTAAAMAAATPTATLSLGSSWGSYPSFYEFSGTTFTTYYLPLWKFQASPDSNRPTVVPVGTNLWGVKLVKDTDLEVAQALAEDAFGSIRSAAGLVAASGH